MHETKSVNLNEIYNFRSKYFMRFSVFTEMNAENQDLFRIFIGFSIKNQFVPICTIMFVINVSQYITRNIGRLKKIWGNRFSELYPKRGPAPTVKSVCVSIPVPF